MECRLIRQTVISNNQVAIMPYLWHTEVSEVYKY